MTFMLLQKDTTNIELGLVIEKWPCTIHNIIVNNLVYLHEEPFIKLPFKEALQLRKG